MHTALSIESAIIPRAQFLNEQFAPSTRHHRHLDRAQSHVDFIEKRVALVMVDISGYTRFMVENQTSAVKSQQCITFLMEALIREVNLPLHVQEIEGDALFLYAEDPGSNADWEKTLEQIPTTLGRLFDVFHETNVLASKVTPTNCETCTNSHKLGLKIIVHTGVAVFHAIGGFPKISGPDVILAHRLLKNSVPGNKYLLLSESAYHDIGRTMGTDFIEGSENYDAFGTIKTFRREIGNTASKQCTLSPGLLA